MLFRSLQNTEYDADKFDGIVLESYTQVKRNDSNEAYVALTLRIGGGVIRRINLLAFLLR